MIGRRSGLHPTNWHPSRSFCPRGQPGGTGGRPPGDNRGALKYMAIEVRIPTILRTYTGGAKAVEGSGATLDELLNNLDAAHGGLRERLVDGEKRRRFVNVYLNDEDVRFLGGLETPVKDGDTVTVLPAVAGGGALGGAPGGGGGGRRGGGRPDGARPARAGERRS